MQKSVTPTRRSPRPRAKIVSVILGVGGHRNNAFPDGSPCLILRCRSASGYSHDAGPFRGSGPGRHKKDEYEEKRSRYMSSEDSQSRTQPKTNRVETKNPRTDQPVRGCPFLILTLFWRSRPTLGAKRTMLLRQVFWLFGSSYRLRLPIPADSGVNAAFVLESQRRARSRFQRDSLLSLHGHHSFSRMGRTRDCQEERFINAAGISA